MTDEPVPWAWKLPRPPDPDRPYEDLSWQDRGACRNYPADWWSQDQGRTKVGRRAKQICRTLCPVRDECLDYAIRHDEPKGIIWGGLSKPERDRLAAERSAAA